MEASIREAVQAVRDGMLPAKGSARWTSSDGTYPVYRGWPAPATLDIALSTGKPIVTVYSRVGFGRVTTRFPNEEVELPRALPTLTVSVAEATATFAGIGGPAQLAGVQVGTTGYSVRAPGSSSDTATALAAIVPGASAAGSALTVPGLVAARTGADGGTLRPTRQLQQGFSVIVWSADPVQRDAIAGAIDAALSDISFLALADGSFGRLTYSGTAASDKAENAGLYKRELFLLVEYSTTIAATRTPVLFSGATLGATQGQALTAGALVGAAVPVTAAAPAVPALVASAQTAGFAVLSIARVGALSP